MQNFIITGGKRLSGEIELQGCKNSTLPIMAAAILVNGKCNLESCPNLTDVYSAARILNYLGCKCSIVGNRGEIDASAMTGSEIPERLMREMRSSIMFMGAILGRMGECTFSNPGGCELGPRPIDMHLAALAKMGAEIHDYNGRICCRMPKGRARGARLSLSFPSVSNIIEMTQIFHVSADYLLSVSDKIMIDISSLHNEEKEIVLKLLKYFENTSASN